MPKGAPLSDVRIYDASGRIVKTINPETAVETFTINVSDLNVGMHYMTVRTSDDSSSTLKFIVE